MSNYTLVLITNTMLLSAWILAYARMTRVGAVRITQTRHTGAGQYPSQIIWLL